MPGYKRTILCLANSRKNTGRCIAGKVIGGGPVGEWVRPVSSRATGELSEEERRYENGQDPKLLDVITIPLKGAQSEGHQRENHLIDDGFYWEFVRKASAAEVELALDHVRGPLWDNASSSYNGLHDRVAESAVMSCGYSLRLIKVVDLAISVGTEGAEFGNGKRKVRGRFSLNGEHYLLSVTDPSIERRYFAGTDGTFPIGPAILCISLGEVYLGYAYKLIAGVLLPT